MAGSQAGFALDTEALVEQPSERRKFFAGRIGADRCGLRLCPFPWHGHVAVLLARRGGDDQRSALELRAVQRANVSDNELRRVSLIAVFMPLDVETNHVIAFGKQAVSPAAEATKQVNCERFGHEGSPRRGLNLVRELGNQEVSRLL
jgi:hypothetical protein